MSLTTDHFFVPKPSMKHFLSFGPPETLYFLNYNVTKLELVLIKLSLYRLVDPRAYDAIQKTNTKTT